MTFPQSAAETGQAGRRERWDEVASPFEVDDQTLRRLVPMLRVLLEELGDDEGEGVRNGGVDGAHELRTFGNVSMDDLEGVETLGEGDLAGEDLEERRANRVEVRSKVGGLVDPASTFGSEVGERLLLHSSLTNRRRNALVGGSAAEVKGAREVVKVDLAEDGE